MSIADVPPGMIPYLTREKIDNSSLRLSILNINIVFVSLMLVTAALRFWVRFRMLRAVGLDDILMIVALFFALLLTASSLIGRYYGLGEHLWNLTPDILAIPTFTPKITKALYGCYLSYALAIAFVKFSIVATYFRVFADGLLRRTIAFVASLVVGLLICNIFAIIFTCIPVQAAWDYSIKGKCFPIAHFFYASSGINIATDLALCFLPIPTLWKLSMPRSQRLVLCILFGLGSFTCVASILRLTQLKGAGGEARYDFSYSTVTSLNWCVIEVGTAIMCASLAALRPLATRYLPRLFSFTNSNHHATTRTSRNQTSVLNNLSQGTKLSSFISRPRPVSKLPGEEEGEQTPGHIYVQQTFDVREEVWDGEEMELKGSTVVGTADRVVVKVESFATAGDEGSDTEGGNHNGRVVLSRNRSRDVLDGRSSDEEELVQGKGGGRRTPIVGSRR